MRSSDLAFPPRLGGSADSEGHATLGTTLDAYRRATFSLQPAGDDPARKGILDSLTCGCIPVLFYEQQAALWPLHWRDWAPQASVLLPHEAVLNGSLDVMRTLAAIPHERVALMQATIERWARRVHYAVPGGAHKEGSDGAGADALDVLLEHLHPLSESRA